MALLDRNRRRGRTVAVVLGALATAMLATAGPAAAAEPPACWNNDVWARAGQTRTFSLYCPRTERIEVISEPHDSRLEGLVQSDHVRFRLTPEPTAPEHDEFVLRLTGPGGSADAVVEITNVPLERNTAPRCEPASVAQRTPGTTPEAVSFNVLCWDAEHDDYTLYGGGPGSFPDAPLHNDGGTAGQSVPSWRYVPTIASGEEQTTYYAIDSLGARSADAPISVSVGPAVDRRPICSPSVAWNRDFGPIYTRPGATRHFALSCEDPDGDALTVRMEAAPTRGELTSFANEPGRPSYSGTAVRIAATYVPRTRFEGVDPFSVRASTERGDTVAPLGMEARELPANSGKGCGWSGGQTQPGVPTTLWASCTDDDGDPLSVDVTSPPAHGSAAPAVLTEGPHGEQEIRIRYTPDAGYTGLDSMSVKIADAGGDGLTLPFEIAIRDAFSAPPKAYTIGTPFDWPELRPPPTGATWLPATRQAPPVSPLDQARRALGQRSVRLVKQIGDARIYALGTALPTSAKPRRALAVTCPVRCTVTSSGSVAGASAGSAKLTVKPGKASALTLRLSPEQRRQVQRAGSARAIFRLKVTRAERKVRRGTVKLSVRADP